MSDLTIIPVRAAAGSVFDFHSYIVHGTSEAVIVDTQFETSNATLVADAAAAVGLPVTRIVITHSDPDFYFGTAVLAARFPNAEIISSAATSALIEANHEAKLTVWKPQLGDRAPETIIVPTPVSAPFTIDGARAEFVGLPTDPDHTLLWLPESRVAIGGIYTPRGAHLWLADSKPAFSRTLWQDALTDVQRRRPTAVYPAHSVEDVPTTGVDAAVFTETIVYLDRVEQALRENDSTPAVVDAIVREYPDLPGRETLEQGIAVIRGETPWQTWATYAGDGSHWVVDFGAVAFDLDFTVAGTLTFTGVKGDGVVGATDTIPYDFRLIAPATFLVYWQEASGARVTHVQDFASGLVYSEIAAPDGSFAHLEGTLRPAKTAS